MPADSVWTYGDPRDSDLYAFRFEIGDTTAATPQMSDAEAEYLLATHGSVRSAAIAACTALEAKAASGGIDKQVGDLRISGSQLARNYQSLRKALTRQAALGVVPCAGGISVQDKIDAENDTDRTAPSFIRGQFDSHQQAGGRPGASDDPDWIS